MASISRRNQSAQSLGSDRLALCLSSFTLTNNPREIEDLMARGFTVFTMQRRDPAAFDAIAAGRKISGRR